MFGLIMIGGRGTRFWPLSRIKRPKQLIDFNGSGEMIKITVNRLKPLIPDDKLYIVTSKNIVKPVKKILPEIKNVIGEPEGRNTAPCIAMIVGLLLKESGDEVMGVFPGDHFIAKKKEFIKILRYAEKIAKSNDALITIGIKPTAPHTGYGYIEYSEKIDNAYKVRKFYEKPDYDTARNFLERGNFLWNAGIFVWRIKTIAEAFKKHQPKIYESILNISNASKKNLKKVIEQEYSKMPKISVDYAIMELSDNILTIPSDIGWNDIGSWSSMTEINKLDEFSNVLKTSENVIVNSSNNIVFSKNKLVALINIDNLVIVEDEDALLICPRSADQKVSEIVRILENTKREKYL